MTKRPNQRKLKKEENQFKKALVKLPKEFEQVEKDVEHRENLLWKLLKPMKELGKKKLKKGKARHLR